MIQNRIEELRYPESIRPCSSEGEERGNVPGKDQKVELLTREAGVDQIGELALRHNLISVSQLEECLQIQLNQPSRMLGQILIQKGYLSAQRFADLLQEQLRRVPLYRKIGRYSLQGVLGEGSCGVVFLARDCRLGRKVALKVLRTGTSSFAYRVEQFKNEANHAARLNHPNIVSIHDAGQEGELCYIAMERVLGRSITEWGRSHVGRWKTLGNVLVQVARALHHAHERGILHRDLKPRNILVDRDGRPQLLDFSLSCRLQRPGASEEIANIIGTPSYMSPEQVEGRVEDLDVRSDLFSFGIVMYELLAGRLPFEGRSIVELFGSIREKEPAPMPGVPEELSRICFRALAKNPDDRYQKAWHLSADLDRYLEEGTRSFLRKQVGGAVKKVQHFFGFEAVPKAYSFSPHKG